MPFPWPGRTDRRAAVAAARAERERSRDGAARAAVITAQIEAMAEANHFAQRIADDIVRRHYPGGEGGDGDTG